MARQTYDAWLPQDWNDQIWHSIRRTSVIESVAKRFPMSTDTKTFARSGDMTVDVIPKGTAYGEDINTADTVILQSKKFGRAVRIAEEDIDDVNAFDVLLQKKLDWASAYAKMLDNACLGVSAAIGAGVPFKSVYNSVTTADATVGYTANANAAVVTVAQLAAAGGGYAQLSSALGVVENSDFFDEGNAIVIAHPSWKGVFRGITSTTGEPLFVEGLAGTPDTLFGYSVKWARGARVTATATSAPPVQNVGGAAGSAPKGTPGNPLLIVCDPTYLMLGVRSGPESVVIPGRDGVSALTDETILKMRSRRAFSPAYPQAFSVLERTV